MWKKKTREQLLEALMDQKDEYISTLEKQVNEVHRRISSGRLNTTTNTIYSQGYLEALSFIERGINPAIAPRKARQSSVARRYDGQPGKLTIEPEQINAAPKPDPSITP